MRLQTWPDLLGEALAAAIQRRDVAIVFAVWVVSTKHCLNRDLVVAVVDHVCLLEQALTQVTGDRSLANCPSLLLLFDGSHACCLPVNA